MTVDVNYWYNAQVRTIVLHTQRLFSNFYISTGKDENGNDIPKTIISKEYSSEWKPGDEPYYPVNDEKNQKIYAQYADEQRYLQVAEIRYFRNVPICEKAE